MEIVLFRHGSQVNLEDPESNVSPDDLARTEMIGIKLAERYDLSRVGSSPRMAPLQSAYALSTHGQARTYEHLRQPPYLGTPEVRANAQRGILPDGILRIAENILNNLPDEPVISLHSLTIGGICVITGQYKSQPVPGLCEYREITI